MKLGRAIPTPIRIMPTDSHGFIVDIGFATFACNCPKDVLQVLEPYLDNASLFIEKLETARGGKVPIPPTVIKTPGKDKVGNTKF